MDIVVCSLKEGMLITLFVFMMLIFIDYFNVLTEGKMNSIIKGGVFRQYVIASFLGVTPGCLGSFMNVSFYVHGLLSFGALVGGMIATTGDETFVMLAVFPMKAMILFGILFALGIIFPYIIDRIVPILKIKLCSKCELSKIHFEDTSLYFDFKKTLEYVKKISLIRFLIFTLFLIFIWGFLSGNIGPKVWEIKNCLSLFTFGSYFYSAYHTGSLYKGTYLETYR